MSLREDVERAINGNNAENASNTPDFVLAEFLLQCLAAFDNAVRSRDDWYGIKLNPAQGGSLESTSVEPTESDKSASVEEGPRNDNENNT